VLSCGGFITKGSKVLRIFIYKSEAKDDLRAFAAALDGSGLPAHLGPWHGIGVVRPELDPPFGLSRDVIEKAIAKQGFQLFRVKPKKSKAA